MRAFLGLRYGPKAWIVNVLAGLLLVLAATAPARAAGPLTLLALGDSLTAGYGLPQDRGFTAQLQAALADSGRNVRVINGGVSGDTTAGGLARLDWALGAAGPNGPDAVLLELGANDGLRGLPPEDTRRNLDAILARLAERRIPVLVAGMLAPPNLGRRYGAAYNALFPDLAEAHGVPLYPFFLDGVAAQPDLNQDDGIHPNAEGVAVVVERILPSVQALLDGVRP